MVDSADESRDLILIVRRREVGKTDGLRAVCDARCQPEAAAYEIN